MKNTRAQKIIAVFALAIMIGVSAPFTSANAETTTTGSGYGGECTIPVTPPSGGFGLSATPIYRPWWEYWSSPKVWLDISGGNAYDMMVSSHSDFSGAYKQSYKTGLTWKVHRSDREGWKTVYVKFFSSCGKESPTISRSYYYWGW